jgi:hypothetical protein
MTFFLAIVTRIFAVSGALFCIIPPRTFRLWSQLHFLCIHEPRPPCFIACPRSYHESFGKPWELSPLRIIPVLNSKARQVTKLPTYEISYREVINHFSEMNVNRAQELHEYYVWYCPFSEAETPENYRRESSVMNKSRTPLIRRPRKVKRSSIHQVDIWKSRKIRRNWECEQHADHDAIRIFTRTK